MSQVPLSLLAATLPAARLRGRPNQMVQRLITDSRSVQPGDLFACVRGSRADGHQFAAEAVRRGATAVMLSRNVAGVDPAAIGILEVEDIVSTLKFLAPRFYNYPSLSLQLAGVTGTSGKTTVTHLLRSILNSRPPARNHGPSGVGLIGTIRNEIAGQVLAAVNTTPMAWDVQYLLSRMVEKKCNACIMEVSSHALAEGRVEGCEFDVAVFTNLTPEHLDFHHTLDEYAAAKKKLFASLASRGYKSGPKYAVLNRDDPRWEDMAKAAQGAKLLLFGLDNRAPYTAQEIKLHQQGSTFRLQTPGGSVRVRLPLLGRFNVANALAAAAAAQALGVPLPVIRRGLERVSNIPGRVEKLPGPQPFTVMVDYAHKPDALEKILRAAREFTPKKLIVVFGCGGDRDASKRAPMGEIAVKLADLVVVTSDNPRSEDPGKIMEDILVGCRRAENFIPLSQRGQNRIFAESDRAKAIRIALHVARKGDTVLLAGKGHEQVQIFQDRVVRFSDHDAAVKELARLGYRAPARGQKGK